MPYGPDHTAGEVQHPDAAERGGRGRPGPASGSGAGAAQLDAPCGTRRAPGRASPERHPPSPCRYGGPGGGVTDASSSRPSTPRSWRWRASRTSAGVLTPVKGHPARWAMAVSSARVCDSNHGYSAASRISLVSPRRKASGWAKAARRSSFEHVEHGGELLGGHLQRDVAVAARENAVGGNMLSRRNDDRGLALVVLPTEPSARPGWDRPSASDMAQSTRVPTRTPSPGVLPPSAPSAAVCPVRHSAMIPGSFTGWGARRRPAAGPPTRPPGRPGRSSGSRRTGRRPRTR